MNISSQYGQIEKDYRVSHFTQAHSLQWCCFTFELQSLLNAPISHKVEPTPFLTYFCEIFNLHKMTPFSHKVKKLPFWPCFVRFHITHYHTSLHTKICFWIVLPLQFNARWSHFCMCNILNSRSKISCASQALWYEVMRFETWIIKRMVLRHDAITTTTSHPTTEHPNTKTGWYDNSHFNTTTVPKCDSMHTNNIPNTRQCVSHASGVVWCWSVFGCRDTLPPYNSNTWLTFDPPPF